MKNFDIKLVFMFTLLPIFIKSVNITIDASCMSTNSTMFSTLSEAISHIVNSQRVISGNTTIILNANTNGTIQTLPSFDVAGGSGGIDIIYEPALSSSFAVSNCSVLPNLLLSPEFSSQLSVSNINHFTITGVSVTIVYSTSAPQNSFMNVGNVTFSNVCLNTSDYPISSSSDSMPDLKIALLVTVSNFLFSNVAMTQNSSGCILIQDSENITIQGLSLSINPAFNYSKQVFYLAGINVPNINSIITNFTFSCPTWDNYHPITIFSVVNISQSTVTNVAVSNCVFAEGDSNFLFALNSCGSLYFENATFQNILISNTSFATSFVSVMNSNNTVLKDFTLENITVISTAIQETQVIGNLLIFVGVENKAVLHSASLQNFQLANSSFSGQRAVITVGSLDKISVIENIYLDQFSFTNCQFYETEAMQILAQYHVSSTTVNQMAFFYISNLKFIGCTFNETIAVYLLIQKSDPTAYLIEEYCLVIENFTMSNNTFVSIPGSEAIEVTGAQLRIINLTAVNNLAINTLMITCTITISTFTLLNSNINGLILQNSAYFVGYTNYQTYYYELENSWYNGSLYYAETRPLSIINTTLTNITLTQGSFLIRSNNPINLIINSTFQNIVSTTSSLIYFRAYIPPVQKPVGDVYAASSVAEDQSFVNFTSVEQAYRAERVTVSSYNLDNQTSIFFTSVHNNTFQNITSNNETGLITLLDITIETSSFGFFNNSFFNVIVDTTQDFMLFSFSQLESVYLNGLVLNNVSGEGYAVGFSSTTIDSFIVISATFETLTQMSPLYVSASICGSISIVQGTSSNITISRPYAQITCQTATSQISIQDSIFSNITVIANPEELTQLNFFSINLQESQTNTTKTIISNNSFSDIFLDKTSQGFGQGVFPEQMLVFALSNSSISFTDNTLTNLRVVPNDNILSISALNITFENCYFSNLTHYEISGAIYLLFQSLLIENSTFEENTGLNTQMGGLLELVSPNPDGFVIQVAIINTTFMRNIAPTSSVLHIEGCRANISITNSLIVDNCAVSSGVILLETMSSSNLVILNTIFQLAYLYNNPTYAYDILEIRGALAEIDVEIINCSLNVNGRFIGDLISVNQNQNTILSIINLIYRSSIDVSLTPATSSTGSSSYSLTEGGSTSTSLGLLNADRINASIVSLQATELNLINNKPLFTMYCLNNGGGQLYFGSMTLSSSLFNNLAATASLIAIQPQDLAPSDLCQLSLSVDRCNFTNLNATSVEGAVINSATYQLGGGINSTPIIQVTNSNFANISAQTGGVYFGQRQFNNSAIYFDRNLLMNISTNLDGGVFYITSASQLSTTTSSQSLRRALVGLTDILENYTILNSNFQKISSRNGGIYYSAYPNGNGENIQLVNNSFAHISVEQRGAVLYLYNHSLSSKLNNFSTCSANISGSLVYMSHLSFNLQSFLNSNTLSSDISSSAQPVALAPNTLDVNLITPLSFVITPLSPQQATQYGANSVSFIVTNISSYDLEQVTFQANLMYTDDQLSEKVIDDSSTTNTSATFTFTSSSIGTKKLTGSCSQAVCYAENQDLILPGVAGTIITIFVYYESGNVQSNTYYNASLNFIMQLRACLPGEVNITSKNYCEYCSNGTFSLSPNDTSCSPCPIGATCAGGTNLILESGYWRDVSTNSELVIACNDSGSRCLGGSNASCDNQYSGPVCAQCNIQNWYLPSSNGNCIQCQSKSEMVLLAVSVLIGLLVYQGFVIVTTFKDLKKSYLEIVSADQLTQAKSERAKAEKAEAVKAAEYLVVLTTYSQISSVISTLNVGYMSNFISVTLPIANPSQQAMSSVGCLTYLETMDLLSMLKLEVLWFVFSPFVKLLIIGFFEIIRALIKRKEQEKKKKALMRLGLCIVVLILLEQPGIVSTLGSYLSCTRLDPNNDTTYIAAINNIECETDEYNSFRNLVVIPALAFWGFAVPLGIFLILYINKQNLHKSEIIRQTFGSLYSHYSEKAYFWGLVIMVFKITLFTLNSLLQVSNLVKQSIYLFVIHIYFRLYKYVAPHTNVELEATDSYITQSFLWSLSFAVVKDTLEIANLSASGVIINMLILVANVLPVGFLLFKLAVIYLKSFKETFKKFKNWRASKRKAKKEKTEKAPKTRKILQTKKIHVNSNSTLKDDSKSLEDLSLEIKDNFS